MLSSTELPPLTFTPTTQKLQFKMPTTKIGWIHSEADKAGASFDLKVKDVYGRTHFERLGCKSGTKEFSELVNHPTLVGEELFVEVVNLKGADSLKLFLN